MVAGRTGFPNTKSTQHDSAHDPLVSRKRLAEVDTAELVVGSAEFLKYIEESRAIKVVLSPPCCGYQSGLLLSIFCGESFQGTHFMQ